jgi:hypothetical protein
VNADALRAKCESPAETSFLEALLLIQEKIVATGRISAILDGSTE